MDRLVRSHIPLVAVFAGIIYWLIRRQDEQIERLQRSRQEDVKKALDSVSYAIERTTSAVDRAVRREATRIEQPENKEAEQWGQGQAWYMETGEGLDDTDLVEPDLPLLVGPDGPRVAAVDGPEMRYVPETGSGLPEPNMSAENYEADSA